jgi:hypothetical protein
MLAIMVIGLRVLDASMQLSATIVSAMLAEIREKATPFDAAVTVATAYPPIAASGTDGICGLNANVAVATAKILVSRMGFGLSGDSGTVQNITAVASQ